MARRVVEKMKTGQNNRMGSGSISGRREIDPLSRLYESNGPSVKIRGSALQVAEKYLQLARDAHTGSNPVATENYLQHAEHYFRLIADAKAAQLRTRDGGHGLQKNLIRRVWSGGIRIGRTMSSGR